MIELLRVVAPQKYLLFIDNLPLEFLKVALSHITIDYESLFQEYFVSDCQWNREEGNRANEMYAQSYLQQKLNSSNSPIHPENNLKSIRNKMLKNLETQLDSKEYFNPWGTIHLLLIKRK